MSKLRSCDGSGYKVCRLNTFFASDFHLGTDGITKSSERERLIVKWLDESAPDMKSLYLVGRCLGLLV
jgi:hypothetical protein